MYFLSLFVALWFYSILFHFILFGTKSLTTVMAGLNYVDQAWLEFTEIPLPLPLKCLN